MIGFTNKYDFYIFTTEFFDRMTEEPHNLTEEGRDEYHPYPINRYMRSESPQLHSESYQPHNAIVSPVPHSYSSPLPASMSDPSQYSQGGPFYHGIEPGYYEQHSHDARNRVNRQEDVGYTDRDILLGKGGRANNHMGNRVFLRLVQLNKQQFREMTTRQKDILIQSILMAIQQNGGRFRQRKTASSAEWETAPWEKAFNKCKQALREIDRKTHKSAVAANEAADAKAAELMKSVVTEQSKIADAKPGASATAAMGQSKKRSLSYSDSGRDSRTSHVKMHSRYSLPEVPRERAAARPSRHYSLPMRNSTVAADMQAPHSHTGAFSPFGAAISTSQDFYMQNYANEAIPYHSFRTNDRHHGSEQEQQYLATSSAFASAYEPIPLEQATAGFSLSSEDHHSSQPLPLPPPPPPTTLQRNETHDSYPGPPVETLLERQDSLVGHHAQLFLGPDGGPSPPEDGARDASFRGDTRECHW